MIVDIHRCHRIPCKNKVIHYIKVTWPHRFIDNQRIVGVCNQHRYTGIFGASKHDIEEIGKEEAFVYEIMEC